MDIFKALNRHSNYSKTQLQLIFGAWVLSGFANDGNKVSVSDGHISEEDYDKRSVYSLLYAMYRSMGNVLSETGQRYELTFNTWGYTWPEAWGACPTMASDPQRFGKNAYTGLFASDAPRRSVHDSGGRVHVVEMGCGTGAGAHEVCARVLPECTYEAVDMQQAAISTCERKYVPELGGRLVARCADATALELEDGVADFVAVNETHVTEVAGCVTDEDKRFFGTAHRLLRKDGLLVWGNAIPDTTWKPCFDYLDSIGMRLVEVRDVTKEAVRARDEDQRRVDAFVDQTINAFHAFRIPFVGAKKREQAEQVFKNFCRNPGTKLYENMVDGTDTYKVVVARKCA